jgi:hypothetical protein
MQVLTKWVNAVLASANPPIQVKDIVQEVDDGIILCTLVECFSNTVSSYAFGFFFEN